MAGGALLQVLVSADYPARPQVLRDVEFSVAAGEMFGLVGQSGSGKSTLALTLLGLLKVRGGGVRGSIRFQGEELIGAPEPVLRRLRGRSIAFVPQSPLSALNPALRLRTQFRELWRAHERSALDEGAVGRLMESVSLPSGPAFLERYPGELSVGQGQRVLIAMALLHRPALIIADEPTSALDVITQSEIIRLFRRLNEERGAAMLFISHDLLSVSALCHRIGILKDGELVECGGTPQVLRAPIHEYSRRLVMSMPRVCFDEGAGARISAG